MSAEGPESVTSVSNLVSDLNGVGPTRTADLAAAGVHDTRALLARFPRSYRLRPPQRALSTLELGQKVTVIGAVLKRQHRSSRRHRGGHLKVTLDCDGAKCELQFFNQGWLRTTLIPGVRIAASGTVTSASSLEITVSDYLAGGDITQTNLERPQAVYTPIGGIKPKTLQNLVRDSFALEGEGPEDPIPVGLLEKRNLLDLKATLTEIHFPQTQEKLAEADRRLVYQGFLARALRIETTRVDRASALARSQTSRRIAVAAQELSRVLAYFPFEFTGGQRSALDAILKDLGSEIPMRRLVQGDVGCGKTAVASAAAILVGGARRQVAVLAPTEALARQFFRELASLADRANLKIALLIGAASAGDRRKCREGLADGSISLVVGTHAVFGDRVQFKNLALVVVDEQHRFGVLQRLRLIRKGDFPHLLAMSATPIPRTLAMSLYADLEATSIRERPPGRQGIETINHVSDRDGKFDWAALAESIRQGDKAFIVFPAIESETGAIPSLLNNGRAIARRFFKKIPLAAVHGRMKADEKAQNLESFRAGRVRVLFATTVIEVGVDVPDATTIVILGANRFGLAQLHQLRGRVGRGDRPGRCYLLSKGKGAVDSERLNALLETDDGFEIAERDLDLRGPGDMMGLRQHGLGPMTSHHEDDQLLAQALEDARDLIQLGVDSEPLARELEFWSRKRPLRGRELVDAG